MGYPAHGLFKPKFVKLYNCLSDNYNKITKNFHFFIFQEGNIQAIRNI